MKISEGMAAQSATAQGTAAMCPVGLPVCAGDAGHACSQRPNSSAIFLIAIDPYASGVTG
ncbi:MAG: hypothetical protein ACK5OA_03220 [Acidovorax sp.]